MQRLIREYLVQVIAGVGVVATVTIWALIDKLWTWPNAVVGATLLTAALVYLMDRFDIGPSLRSRVRDWLDSSTYAITTVQDANAFHFRMVDNVLMTTDIIQAKGGGPIEITSAHHLATPDQLAAFKALSAEAQGRFWKGVRRELLKSGVAYSALTLEGPGVNFTDSVMPSRTLTAIEFLHRVMIVRSTARLYKDYLLDLTPASLALVGSGPAGSPPQSS